MTSILKKLIFVTVLIIFSVSMAYAQTVRVGVAAEPYPPFTTPDGAGNWSGWEIDIMKAICEEGKLDCVIAPTSWDGIIPALMAKKIDLIFASMMITEERMKSIDFSDKYYNVPTVVIGTKKMKFDATPESLKGRYIGVQSATIQKVYAEKYFTESTIKEYQTQDEVNQDLVSGRIDATQADALALAAFLETEEGKACCEVKGMVADDPVILGSGVGVGIRKGDEDLKSKINAAITAIRANGKYEKISKKYFDFDIYGE